MGKANSPGGPGARTQGESNPGQKGPRDRNSPTCTLSQNGYGEGLILRFGSLKKTGPGVWERWGEDPNSRKSAFVESEGSVNIRSMRAWKPYKFLTHPRPHPTHKNVTSRFNAYLFITCFDTPTCLLVEGRWDKHFI